MTEFMSSRKYILKGHDAVLEPDLIKWAIEFENHDRRVAEDVVNGKRISTVFLGIDHSITGGPPLLFETMVFPMDNYSELDMDRYSTWEEAEAGHKAMVRKHQN